MWSTFLFQLVMNFVIGASGPNLADGLAYPIFGTKVTLLKNSNPRAGIFIFVLHTIAKFIATEFVKGPAERIT